MTIRAVLFDLDGTLVDTWFLYIESYRHGLQSFFDRPVTLEEIVSYRPNSEIRMFTRVVGREALADVLESFYKFYHDHHDKYFEGIYSGVAEMLSDLRKRGYRLGIVTGKSRRAYNITSGKCGLGNFDVVVSDDDVENLKPDPEGIIKALGLLKIGPEEAIYVGDAPNDKRAAEAAGVLFGGTLWSKTEREAGRFAEKIGKIEGESILFKTPGDLSNYLTL